jgi:pimeloyl-ACP methyl ester carboxylesterase
MKLFGLLFVYFLLFTSSAYAETFKIQGGKQEIGFFKMGKGARNIVLVPGIGDLKENYLDLAREISTDATVFALDLRGLGESSVSFESYGADETGKDLVDFINHYNLKQVTIVANSMSAASAIYAASRLEESVEAIVLTGPFIRDAELGFFMRNTIRVLFAGPWGPSTFQSFYEGLYPINKPADLGSHSDRIKANLKEDGRMEAVRAMFLARKPESEKSISSLKSKVAIVMGDKDPDFDDPLAEAKTLASMTKGEYFMFKDCGHYPYKEDPKKLKEIVLGLWLKK